jgi:hypothetical protein
MSKPIGDGVVEIRRGSLVHCFGGNYERETFWSAFHRTRPVGAALGIAG